jgi:hypothetical protein
VAHEPLVRHGTAKNRRSVFFLGLEGLVRSLFDSFANLLVVGGRRNTNVFFRRWLLRLSLLLLLALRVTFGHLALLQVGSTERYPEGARTMW